jgi:hypothetical protein
LGCLNHRIVQESETAADARENREASGGNLSQKGAFFLLVEQSGGHRRSAWNSPRRLRGYG